MAADDPTPSAEQERDRRAAKAEPQTQGQAEPATEAPDSEGDAFPGFDELLGSFMGEPSLWPVLIVVLGSAGAFGAAALILAFVDHNPFAAAALVLIFGMSLDVVIRGRRDPRYRNAGRLVAMIWASALAFTGLAVWTGLAFG